MPSGNVCNDLAPPSTSYVCTCHNPAYTGTGTTSCTTNVPAPASNRLTLIVLGLVLAVGGGLFAARPRRAA
jgi:hypothetical protein